MSKSRAWLWPAALLVAGAFAPSCSCEEDPIITPPSSGGGGEGGATGGSGGGIFVGVGGGEPGCRNDDDCADDGVCHNGSCCTSLDVICGDGCCDADTVCIFEECVTPGDDCVTDEDCPDDHICDPSLGDNGGGGQAGNCTQPLENGKCVPLPPICGEGGAGGAGGGDCLESCEFTPTPGQLNAVTEWQWGYDPAPTEFPDEPDVWATPVVARVYDANCDGNVDLGDPPNIIFVSGDNAATCCHCGGGTCTGVLRVLDGKSGEEIWSKLETEASSGVGFTGISLAVGDVDQNGTPDIVTVADNGTIAILDGEGNLIHQSTDVVDANVAAGQAGFGWGGGLALGDMDGDGWTEIAYGRSVFTMQGGTLALLFHGTGGRGRSTNLLTLTTALSHFADLDGNGDLELIAGNTAYDHVAGANNFIHWENTSIPEGFTATGDFDGDNLPEIVHVSGGNLRILEGATGVVELGPQALSGTGHGGPPTVADFDGDGEPEIGVATATRYSAWEPDVGYTALVALWTTPPLNHDNSSSVTGSSVFDFEGDGQAEVVYNDECYLWVYDGSDGSVLFTANTQSFTATEATIVADVDGDGHAEIVMGSNGSDTTSWHCAHHDGTMGYPVWTPPATATDYRGITVFGDAANAWVGTRMLWNQHAYSVSNVCDPRDSACPAPTYHGEVPQSQVENWTLPWLNNFRQNVQDSGLFNAPDAVVDLTAECTSPVQMRVVLRNNGLSGLVTNVQIDIYQQPNTLIGTVYSTRALLPGQAEIIPFTAPDTVGPDGVFEARIVNDPLNPTFRECRDDNNTDTAAPECVQ